MAARIQKPHNSVGEKELKFFQLNNKNLNLLKSQGIYTLNDYVEHYNSGSCEYGFEDIFRPIFSHLLKDGTFNWIGYYEQLEEPPNYPCFCGHEFDEFRNEFGEMQVCRNNFGKVSVWLNKQGIHTVDDLWSKFTDDAFNPSGFGKTKGEELFSYLLKYLRAHKDGTFSYTQEPPPPPKTKNSSAKIEGYTYQSSELDRLSQESRSIPLSFLHMGPKSKQMKEAGLVSLGDLVDKFKVGFGKIRSLGKDNFEHILHVLHSIEQNIDGHGSIQWKGFCESASIPYIPSDKDITSGASFLDSIPTLISQIIAASTDPIEKLILTERLTKPVKKQKTLDKIASGFGITRERVRQKQKKLLLSLSDAFLFEKYGKLEYRVSDEFTYYFKLAAASFPENTEVTMESFIDQLSDSWEATPAEIIANMPLISAILTGTTTASPALRLDNILAPLLRKELPTKVAEKALKELPLGKYYIKYEEANIITIKDAIAATKGGCIPFGKDRKGFRLLNDIFKKLEYALKNEQTEKDFWLHYALINNIGTAPAAPTETPQEFLNGLTENLRTLVQEYCTHQYSEELFIRRTSKRDRLRAPYGKLAEELNTYGPALDRTENLMISILKSALVDRNLTRSEFYIREDFLDYWEQAYTIYLKCTTDFRSFRNDLASHWRINPKQLDEQLDLIWRIFGCHQNKPKPTKFSKETEMPQVIDTPKAVVPAGPPQIIKLRGFNNVY